MNKTFKYLMAIASLAMTFAACEDVPEPYYIFDEDNTPSTEVKTTGSGTIDDPFNVAAAIAKCQEIGTEPPAESYYVKGIVVSGGSADAQYGNVSFYIADSQDGGDMFYCFQVMGSGGAKLPAGYTVNVGDEVVVYGPIYNYRGNTPETAGKGVAYIVTINGKSTNDTSGNDNIKPEGTGTLTDPFNVAAAMAKCAETGETATTQSFYAKGYVTSITEISADFGNATFIISDDKNGSNQLTVYRALGPGNQKITDSNIIKVGDEVIVYGQLVNFRGNTPEFTQGCYIYSINSSGNDNPTPQPTNESTKDNPFSVTKALEVARALSSSETVANVYVKGVVVEFVSFDAGYHNSRYYIADAADATDRLYIYDGKGLDNADLNAAEDIKVGDEVIVYGTLSNYQGTTPEMNRGNYLVFHNGNGGGNDNPDPQPGTNPGTVDGKTITAAFSEWGLDNEADLNTLTLSDGTSITFAQNDGRNAPKYYTSGATARMYALNSVTIAASKNITKVVFTCEADSRTGNETLYAEAGNSRATVAKDGAVLTFTDIANKSLKVVNDHTSNSGGTQLRIVSIEITYAE